MDLATLIGLISGFGLIIGTMAMGGSLGSFFDGGSVLVVVGGTLAATLIHETLKNVIGAIGVVKNAFFDKKVDRDEMIKLIIHLAQKARKEGLVSLEGEAIEDAFMARGVRLGVDGLSPEVISSTLASEIRALKKRHEAGARIFKFMSSTSPAMGMIGTLIGLVQMLQNLDDPSAIGPGMAVALLTTLYGAVLAFIVFGPLAAKLENRSILEVESKSLAIVGVESILRGDNTLVIQSKLEAFLSPRERDKGDA